MLERQGTALRASLFEGAQLRKAVKMLFTNIQDDNGMDKTLTLGQANVAAEYRTANKVLKKRIKDLEAQVAQEQRLRALLEDKLEKEANTKFV